LLAAADYLIDMGPGGGPEGGRVLAAGTPAEVAADAGSVTGPWLAEYFSLADVSR
jgi:excinuclease ABC subunit A